MQQNLMGEKAFRTKMIKSISYNQNHILKHILKLYCNNAETFECDPCFNKGSFYKTNDFIKDYTIPCPEMIFDINPQVDECEKADCTDLSDWYKDNDCESIIFDPPFLATKGPSLEKDDDSNKILKRFNVFPSEPELFKFYFDCLVNFYEILENNGFLFIKCQDKVSSGKQYFSHVYLHDMAIGVGYYPKDFFVLINRSKMKGFWKDVKQWALGLYEQIKGEAEDGMTGP